MSIRWGLLKLRLVDTTRGMISSPAFELRGLRPTVLYMSSFPSGLGSKPTLGYGHLPLKSSIYNSHQAFKHPGYACCLRVEEHNDPAPDVAMISSMSGCSKPARRVIEPKRACPIWSQRRSCSCSRFGSRPKSWP